MMKSVSPWTLVIILSAVVAGLLTFVAGDAQMRVVFVLWFLLVCPGMMLVRFFRFDEPMYEWIVAVALSLAIDTLVGGILLYSGRWSPSSALVILLVFTIGGVLVQEVNTLRIQRRNLA